MNKKLITAASVILLATMLNAMAKPAVANKDDILELKNHKISITDGDTIRAGEYRLRMQYIDAPEIKQKCKTVEGKEWYCGIKSTQYLQELVGDTKDVKCKIVGHDKYKRNLAICYKDKLDINREMVKAGHALAYIKYGSPYKDDQIDAMRGLKGIWSGTFIEPEIYRKLKKAPLKHMTKEFKEKLDL